MFDLSPIKILVIVAVALVLLGPDKLPEVARKLGSSWRALRQLQQRVEREVREVIPDLPTTGDLARMARNPVSLLNELAHRADPSEDAPETGTATPSPVVDTAAADVAAHGGLIEPPRPSATTPVPDGPDPALN